MRQKIGLLTVYLLLAALLFGCLPSFPSLIAPASAQQKGSINPLPSTQQPQVMSRQVQQQIAALLNEKESRSKTERKISSQLLYATKQKRGLAAAKGVHSLTTNVKVDEKNFTLVNIRGKLSEKVTSTIENYGGEVIYASKEANSLKARVTVDALEAIASLEEVSAISPGTNEAMTHRRESPQQPNQRANALFDNKIGLAQLNIQNDYSARVERFRAQLTKSLAAAKTSASLQDGPIANRGSVTSQGDDAHRAREARNFFGTNGNGVKIGVLSDSIRFLEQAQASGDLPPNVTVIPGQSGVQDDGSDIGEGTAMLEIIHDLAPGAQLFFATAFISQESFADNIRRLRFEYDCDIIVDDVIYFAESPFQDTTVAQAVNDITDDGALFFSSAGNEGNFNDGTSGTWEGDFKNGGTLVTLGDDFEDYTVHDFGDGVISNLIEVSGSPTIFIWGDPYGRSSNDYDLFILNNTLTSVLGASTDVQDGDDIPFEGLGGGPAGSRVVLAKKNGAATRAMNVIVFRGELGIATPGATRGHNSANKAQGVAAVNAAVAGGGAFIGGPTNPVELFSSDGYRRLFYREDGTPITPGNVLFRTRGGVLRVSPNIAAADGVATTNPFLNPFFGTSAAAPHAAAIAALIKSARPTLTSLEIRNALRRTAFDIEARGVDRDSGNGLINAYRALQYVGARARPTLELGDVEASSLGSGDDDPYIEPEEFVLLNVELRNIGGAAATGINARLSTSTPGVTIYTRNTGYPNLSPSGEAMSNQPFIFRLDSSVPCGQAIDFTLRVRYTEQSTPQTFNFTVQTGQPGNDASTVSYTGPPVSIPDGNATGVDVPLEVSGLGSISDLNFRIDGEECSALAGATGVGIDHSWVSDLVITLRSPQGTTVTLINRAGGSGNNFCQTLLDDSATVSIQSITTAGAPYTGTFRPASPLAAFNGENPNGTWTLNVSDRVFLDSGNVRAFSLILSEFACTYDGVNRPGAPRPAVAPVRVPVVVKTK